MINRVRTDESHLPFPLKKKLFYEDIIDAAREIGSKTFEVIRRMYTLDEKIYTVKIDYVDDTTPVVINCLKVKDKREELGIKIKKIDSETKEALSDAVFALYAAEDILDKDGKIIFKKGEMIAKCTSNEKGIAKFSIDIPYGNFYVKEIAAPDGYVKSKDVIKISKSDFNGKTLEFEVENKPDDDPPPKTGDNFNVAKYALITLISIIICLAAMFWKREKISE